MGNQGGEKPRLIHEVIEALARYGFRECTMEANRQQTAIRSASYIFEGPGGDGVFYFCDTVDDVLVLLSLVRSDLHNDDASYPSHP